MAISTISLGKVKFNWRGDWINGTTYAKDDVVKYGPNVYTCVTAHSSQANFADNNNDWDLMVAGLENAGAWNTSTLYKVGQTVTYGGAVYIALQESTNLNPYTNTAYWQKFVDGQQFEGAFSTGVTYQKGDIVSYGGYVYVAKQNTIANTPTNTTYWDIYSKGVVYLGTYDNNTQYKPGESVLFGGNRFIVTEGSTPQGVQPGDGINWQQISAGLSWVGDWLGERPYYAGELVRYGGAVYYCVGDVISDRPDNSLSWEIYADGTKWRGDWSANNDYKTGDIVRFGARNYIAIDSYENDGSTTPEPPNAEFWELYSDGMSWQGIYDPAAEYEYGDVVEFSQSSYICISNDVVGVEPGTDAQVWNLVAQGDISSPMTTEGDIIYRNASGNVERLGIGPAGSLLISNNGIPSWGHQTPQNDYYVSPQGDDTNDGRTPGTSWRTIAHAAEETFNLGQVRINVQAGNYEEQCPIRVGRSVVLEGNGLGAVTVSPNTARDEGFGVGISNDGSTPNANSYVFHMNNGARMRNFVFRGFGANSVIVSLDPGTGPDDTSVWITSQSPYVQNCTSFTPGGTGFKIDGALHNGGYKSMVANDWTQINSDGIGIHALNDGRTEIVSCFTYYCNIGYLAESGAKIRAIVGNNSYGEYGAVARGFSQLETPLTGQLQLSDQTINSVTQLGADVHVFTSYRDSVGNRFFVGHTNPTGTDVTSTFDNTASYPFVAKFNGAGSLDWIYTYENTFGAIHSAIELSDVIYCGGVIYDGSNKGFILAVSKAGEIQWQKTFGDTTEITDLATDNNNLYAVGNHATDGAVAISLNPAGIERWSTTLEYTDGTNTLIPSSCVIAGTPTTSVDTYALAGDATAEGNLYIASYDTTENRAVITRLDNVGNYVTTYEYGDVRINKLRIDTGNGDGIYLMAAGYYDAGAVNKVPLLFRLTVDGEVQWQNNYTKGSEEGEWTDVLPFGNDIYVSGYVNESTNTYNTGVIGRFVSTGSPDWVIQVSDSTDSISMNGVMLDGVNVIAAGIQQADSVIINLQRDLTFDLGTVTSGSYSITESFSFLENTDTIVTKAVNEIDNASITLGTTDTSLTLEQSPTQTRTVVATRSGFAGIGTGVLFNVNNLTRRPKEGSVLQIAGDDETYFVIGVNDFDEVAETATIQIDPAIPSNKTPNDNTGLIFREAFSQVRMSGHDFLDIGTGGFADTNYPVIIAEDYSQAPNQDRETLAEDGGRVFYVTTDQDGNFRVGDYFKVEQATGRATLSSEEFDLAGLNELQLGSITAGKQGATINEFSTDGTFADNSDASVPTEKATKTYVDTQITLKVGEANAIVAGDAPLQSKVSVTGSGLDTDTINFDIHGDTIAEIGKEYMLLPKGATADRPSTPETGMFRYNTTNASLEVYGTSSWEPAGSLRWSIVSVDSNISKGEAFVVDTSGGQVQITLPAGPTLGDSVRIMDKAGTFATNNCVINRNGSNIMGLNENMVLSTENAAIGLVYIDSTEGWKVIEVL
jgi:hypothetical protein